MLLIIPTCIFVFLAMSICFVEQFHLTTEDEQPPYPEWAQFIGALVVLSSVIMIPLFLIVRLIGYQQARDEGMEFITRHVQSFRDFTGRVKRYIKFRWIVQEARQIMYLVHYVGHITWNISGACSMATQWSLTLELKSAASWSDWHCCKARALP